MKIPLCRKFCGVSTHLTFLFVLVGVGCSSPKVIRSGDGTSSTQMVSRSVQTVIPSGGQKLFLKNCAHCHGSDGTGDDGPDLHNLDWADEQIARRIRVGKKGQMTAFGGKLSDDEIRAVVGYLRGLK
jgi:cytochrome c553